MGGIIPLFPRPVNPNVRSDINLEIGSFGSPRHCATMNQKIMSHSGKFRSYPHP